MFSPLGGSPVDMISGSINCETVEIVVNCTAYPTGNLLPNLFGSGLSGPDLRTGNSDFGKRTHLFLNNFQTVGFDSKNIFNSVKT